VIAETSDLPTKFSRIVVTDDQGRYVVPDLPKASTRCGCAGYDLSIHRGRRRARQATEPPRGAGTECGRGAQYYPAIYWYSMLRSRRRTVRRKGNIPRTSPRATGSPVVKNRSCVGCHQLGQLSTRTIPPGARPVSKFIGEGVDPPRAVGQAAPLMAYSVDRVLGGVPFSTSAIGPTASPGASCAHKPPRAQGVERTSSSRRGSGRPKEVSARPDRLGSALSDGHAYAPSTARADTPRTTTRSSIQRRTSVTSFRGPVRTADTPEKRSDPTRRDREAMAAVTLLGRGEDLGTPRQQPQRHVRQKG